ncbi:glycosyltransferase [Butyrivibrio sp. CB08]|uniref:glycosyltransferase family 2 protein n=1 Tax=Butyrivibrio sp. CB08 TaxID=2364879 RepID=UPI000EA9DCF1|nr:glycosyltransferase [Butyrivibrio sp. CB08]RKM60409.1 glycosyltransferase [Butyrivibrio sp. CB08]
MSEIVLCSFIVPLYKGEQYVDGISDMVCRAVEKYLCLKNEGMFEIVFINDWPEEIIELKPSMHPFIKQSLYTNKHNYGIHASRIKGVELANGQYVVFLDQDDIISEDYIYNQMSQIADNDLILCNGINYGEAIYHDAAEMKSALMKDYYIKGNNLIISPGQVMLKKEIIPKEWCNNLVHYNCSDDYFLWTLILYKGVEWEINDNIDFLHGFTDNNTSRNENNMIQSMCEVNEYLYNLGIIKDYDIQSKFKKRAEEWDICGKRLEKNMLDIRALSALLFQKNNQMLMGDYLESIGIHSVAIYGYGYLGRKLYDELRQSNICVSAVFDKNRCCKDDSFFHELGDSISNIDAIIITVSNQYYEIANELRNLFLGRILSLHSIVFNEVPSFYISQLKRRDK